MIMIEVPNIKRSEIFTVQIILRYWEEIYRIEMILEIVSKVNLTINIINSIVDKDILILYILEEVIYRDLYTDIRSNTV